MQIVYRIVHRNGNVLFVQTLHKLILATEEATAFIKYTNRYIVIAMEEPAQCHI